jgi:ABC-2 type transport system permease protein
MNMSAVGALIHKEIKQIKRDVSNILVAIIMPALILAIFGYGMSFDIKDIRVDVVQQDSGKITKDLVDAYVHSEYFNVNVSHSVQEAHGNMESGKTMGTIFIPENFSRNLISGRKAEIQIVSDGTDPNTAAYVETYASGVFHKHMATVKPEKPGGMNIINRLWFNPTTASINFLMAGALTMVISIVGTFLTSLVIAKEWETGTMEALISTPVSIGEIIVSKTVPYFGLCILSLAFSLLCGTIVFRIPFEGSLLAMLFVSSIFITVSLLIGILISTSAKDQFVAAMGAVTVTFLPTFMLSGFVFEISSMPLWLQLLSYVFPAKYYVSSMRTICMAGDIWEIILKDSAVLGLMAIGLLLALRKKLKKNVE